MPEDSHESEFAVSLGYTVSLRNRVRLESTFLLHTDPSVRRRMRTRQSGGKETLSCFSGPALPATESHSLVTIPLRDYPPPPYFFLVQKHWYLIYCLSQILVCHSQDAHLPRSLVMSPASFLAMQLSSDWQWGWVVCPILSFKASVPFSALELTGSCVSRSFPFSKGCRGSTLLEAATEHTKTQSLFRTSSLLFCNSHLGRAKCPSEDPTHGYFRAQKIASV